MKDFEEYNRKHKTKKFKIKRSELAARIIECAKKGLSIRATLAELGVSHNYLHQLVKREPKFSEVLELAAAEREKFYINLGLAITTGQVTPKNGSYITPSIYIWLTKNILGWKDKHEIYQEVDANVQNEIVYRAEFGDVIQLKNDDVKKIEENKEDDKDA